MKAQPPSKAGLRLAGNHARYEDVVLRFVVPSIGDDPLMGAYLSQVFNRKRRRSYFRMASWPFKRALSGGLGASILEKVDITSVIDVLEKVDIAVSDLYLEALVAKRGILKFSWALRGRQIFVLVTKPLRELI
jgi:hypothetical protein